ncbi:MAG: hypothetical protein FWF51_07275 [Chitinivibrionia bacterium]|nr:hypothetical protein [Chitinivibrionia bacterium]
MTVMEKKFNERFARWAERTGAAQTWEQQGRQEGMQQGMQQVLDVLLQEGYDVNAIKSKLPQTFA